jgi:peptidyl-prolyl cis-trans isomerase B (cyclophilin B)
VSPISREREYARRRYEKWQAKQAVKLERRRRQRRNGIIAGSAVAVVLVVVGGFLIFGGSDDKAATASPTPSGTAAASASASASASTSAGPNPCPAPTVKPPAKPQSFGAAPDASLAQGRTWTMKIATSCGEIDAELDGAKAPKAVADMIFLSGKSFWDGSPCHRLGVNTLKILQCGDPTGTGTGGPGYSFGPVENPPSDATYRTGVLAMARGQSEDSQGSQFFIVYGDTQLGGNYTVFGRITKGMDVVTKVAAGGLASVGGDGSSGPPARAISIVGTTVSPA